MNFNGKYVFVYNKKFVDVSAHQLSCQLTDLQSTKDWCKDS